MDNRSVVSRMTIMMLCWNFGVTLSRFLQVSLSRWPISGGRPKLVFLCIISRFIISCNQKCEMCVSRTTHGPLCMYIIGYDLLSLWYGQRELGKRLQNRTIILNNVCYVFSNNYTYNNKVPHLCSLSNKCWDNATAGQHHHLGGIIIQQFIEHLCSQSWHTLQH